MSDENELLRAANARIYVALVFLQKGKPKDAIAALKRLAWMLPPPEPRHIAAANSDINQA